MRKGPRAKVRVDPGVSNRGNESGEAKSMMRTRLVLCLALIGTMGACGGRSGLRALGGDGGFAGEGGFVGDGSADRRFDGGIQDGRFDGLGAESVGTPDSRIEVGTSSDSRIEVGTSSDSRIEVGASEVRAEVGGSDGRDGPATDGGRAEVALPGDARDAGGDVAAATLSSIEIAPPSPTLAMGTTLSVVITGVYSDGSSKDVSSSATVTSGAPAYVTVSGTTLTGVHPGTATITATYQGKSATATVTVLDTTLQSISIQAVAPLPIGQT